MKKLFCNISLFTLFALFINETIAATTVGKTIATNGENLSTDVSIIDNLYSEVIGVKVNSNIAGGAVTSKIVATSTAAGKVYGIWMNSSAASSLGKISGSVSITSNAGNVYGLLFGTSNTADSVGVYNSYLGNSSGFTYDWSKIGISISHNCALNTHNAYGIYASGSSTNIASTGIGGNISVTNSGQARGIRVLESATLGSLLETANVNVSSSGSLAYGIGILSFGKMGSIAGKITTNSSYSGQPSIAIFNTSGTLGDITSTAVISATSSSGIAAGLYLLESSNSALANGVSGTINATQTASANAYGIYLLDSSKLGTINQNSKISAIAYNGLAYGIYREGTSTIGKFSGSINIESSSVNTVHGVVFGRTADGSVGLYNAASQNSEGFDIDWSKASFTINNKTASKSATGIRVSAVSVAESGIGGMTKVTAIGESMGVRVSGAGKVGNLLSTSSISATSQNSFAYGIYAQDASTSIAETLSGSISAESKGASHAYGLYAIIGASIGSTSASSVINAISNTGNSYGLYSSGASKIGFANGISGKINSTATGAGSAYGAFIESDSSIGSINSDAVIYAKSATGLAFGIYKNTGTYGKIGGSIGVESGNSSAIYGAIFGKSAATNSVGLYNSATQNSSNFANIDWNTLKLSAKNTASGDYNAYGISGTGSSTVIAATGIGGIISASTAGSGHAYGLHLTSEASIGAISGTFKAASIGGNAYAIYTSNLKNNAFIFNNAVLDATSANKANAFSLYGEGSISISGSANLKGNVYAKSDMNVSSGNFTFDSPTWNSEKTAIGSLSKSASVKFGTNTIITSKGLDFYANSLSDFSYIKIENGSSLKANLNNINVYLSEFFEYENNDFLTLFKGLSESIVILGLSDISVYKGSAKLSSDKYELKKVSDGYGIVFLEVPEPSEFAFVFGAISILLVLKRKFSK